jgi:hypothetical protein
VALIAFAVRAASGSKLRIETKLQEGIQLGGCFNTDRATSSPVAARWAASRDKLFSAESGHSVSAITAFNEYFGSI